MGKVYDEQYFENWYRRRGLGSPAALQRKVAMALATAEYFLGRPVRSVLDVGCGEGAWRAPLLELRPKLRYMGVDSSEYAIRRHGTRRNLHYLPFGDLPALRLTQAVDLLVCSDVMHYLADAELRTGLGEFARLCDGVAFLEVFTASDDIVGDLQDLRRRPAAWYRREFDRAGFVQAAPHTWLSVGVAATATALELPR
jgi:SAM-dependent methyltransferase